MGTSSGRRPEQDEAFTAAMTLHGDRLARLAWYLCGDRARAEDLVAEAFARTWPKWRAGAVEDLLPYLRRTLTNLAAKEHRHGGVVRRFASRADRPATAAPADEGVGSQLEILGALAGLHADQRAVLVLRYYEDLSEAEIATLLHLPPGTVKSRAARGLATLRARLEGADHD